MNFERELYNKLTYSEWSICRVYVCKAQEYYSEEKYSQAREALLDAVAVCESKGEENAAEKVRYYLRFC